MGALFTALAIPFMLLNMLGGIVGGVWLAILGQWAVIGWGVVAMIAAPFGLSIALMPSMIFGAPALWLEKRNQVFVASIFVFLSVLYMHAVIAIWCVAVTYFVDRYHDGSNMIPWLLWAYTVALAPLSYLAQKDQGTTHAGVTTMFAQFGFVAALIAAIFFEASWLTMSMVIFAVLGIPAVFLTRIAYEESRAVAASGSDGE